MCKYSSDIIGHHWLQCRGVYCCYTTVKVVLYKIETNLARQNASILSDSNDDDVCIGHSIFQHSITHCSLCVSTPRTSQDITCCNTEVCVAVIPQ